MFVSAALAAAVGAAVDLTIQFSKEGNVGMENYSDTSLKNTFSHSLAQKLWRLDWLIQTSNFTWIIIIYRGDNFIHHNLGDNINLII